MTKGTGKARKLVKAMPLAVLDCMATCAAVIAAAWGTRNSIIPLFKCQLLTGDPGVMTPGMFAEAFRENATRSLTQMIAGNGFTFHGIMMTPCMPLVRENIQAHAIKSLNHPLREGTISKKQASKDSVTR